jgi:glycogen debranching enzyme
MAAAPARIGFAAELVLAADTFVITPVGRIADGARARAEGDEVRTVIAGYHWFTDWGRDTMISLEGLAPATGRAIEARWILRTFAHYVRDGLIPNMFPEGQNQGLYHTADATLWFFHALHRYVEHSHDRTTLELLLPILKDIAIPSIAAFGTRRAGISTMSSMARTGTTPRFDRTRCSRSRSSTRSSTGNIGRRSSPRCAPGW